MRKQKQVGISTVVKLVVTVNFGRWELTVCIFLSCGVYIHIYYLNFRINQMSDYTVQMSVSSHGLLWSCSVASLSLPLCFYCLFSLSHNNNSC